MAKSKARGAGRESKSLIADEDELCMQRFGDGTRLQARKAAGERFDLKKKKLFVESLRRTANVSRSARAAGVSVSTAYRHRARFAHFDLMWTEALVHAIDVLETTMLERALRYNASLSEAGADDAEAGKVEPFSNGDAMRLIKLHRESLAQRRIEIAARLHARPEAVRERLTEKFNEIYDRIMAREKRLDDAPA